MCPGSGRLHGDGARYAAERPAPADHAGHRLLVHAVLQRHHVAARGQVLGDEHGGPGRVVGLHAHEGDVDGRLFGELLRLGQVQCAHRHREFRHVPRMGHAQTMRTHVLDVLGPRVDEGHILARLHHVRPGIAAHGTGADDCYLLAHCASLAPCCVPAGFGRRPSPRNLAGLQTHGQRPLRAGPQVVDQASFGVRRAPGHCQQTLCTLLHSDQQKPPSRGARLGLGPLQPRRTPYYITPDNHSSSRGLFPEQVMGAYEGSRVPILLGPDGLPQKEDI